VATAAETLDLLDWKRRIFALYAEVRAAADPRAAWSGREPLLFRPVATAAFELRGKSCRLEVQWLEGYGGGVFLSFRDTTSGEETYGGGRYLYDTVKGADLGDDGGRLVLDFNFAYNPSCAYDPSWVCPLAPAANRLAVAVGAGERYDG